MAITPNADNYTLGRGKILFNRKNSDDSYQGMRDLGNASDFAVSISVDKLEHYSSRTGLKTKDKTVITGMNPSASFVLDEVNSKNLSLTFMAGEAETSQSADDDLTANLASIEDGIYYELDEMFVGVWQLSHGAVTGGPFEVAETVTGGTSSATAEVTRVDASDNVLCINTISGTFVSGETITGGTSSATAALSAAATFNETDVVVTQGSTAFTKGTDYTVSARSGKIFIMDGSTMTDTATVVEFGRKAITYSVLNAFAESSVQGELHFLSDVAEGTNADAYIWDVNLSPSGDFSFISGSDEWNTMEFELEINKDESGHPNHPYIKLVV